jgi:ABC-type sugar transport system ATPase subunit
MMQMMVGRELRHVGEISRNQPGNEVLRVESLSLTNPASQSDYLLQDISLNVRQGEVLGIFGLMGAGRTELLETIFGLHPKRAKGSVFIDGKVEEILSPADAIELGLALAPEDRKIEGLVMNMSVAENTSLASLSRIKRFGLLNEIREYQLVSQAIERFRVKTPSQKQLIRNLSGGNQQKVILGKWLATQPKALLLDEPTRGIDVHAKGEIYALIEELVADGLAVILVSSELPEILAISDRIMVLCEGRKTAEFNRAEANENLILKAALPN